MFELSEPPLFARLSAARRILIAGAGGGFDVYAGLPLALALAKQGKQISFANLSFADLSTVDDWLAPDVAIVGPSTRGPADYFPERTFARWLAGTELAPVVHAFPRVGARRLRTAYEALVEHLGVDTIVLVDGGTDILLRGDESGLGTPVEDMASLSAVAALDGLDRVVVCLGFGIDSHHGVDHADVLENLAALDRDGHFLGAFSIPSASAEATAYREAVEHAAKATAVRPSIVNGQIAAALSGAFGNVGLGARTAGSELFVNPLMAMYFAVDLLGLARSVGYLELLAETDTPAQIAAVIETYREGITLRPSRRIPH
ncbi:DUF1152 domain-containing protein [Kribbella sp. DT2]|uniref:DUF1152 domain-containing protein n=1 Tax=Kribbella sp. DT2 TaxID=3393427 RepID=UPI003CF35834